MEVLVTPNLKFPDLLGNEVSKKQPKMDDHAPYDRRGRDEMSAYTRAKARKLLDTGRVIRLDRNLWTVAASEPGKSYYVSLAPSQCECKGFMYHGDCSHVLAAMLSLSEEQET